MQIDLSKLLCSWGGIRSFGIFRDPGYPPNEWLVVVSVSFGIININKNVGDYSTVSYMTADV